ncbi:MAG: replicative DNA helicase [Pseudomonadota bacterium]
MQQQKKFEKSRQAGTVSMETFHAKIPPHSTEVELSVLGGLMLENAAMKRVADIINPADFYTEAHRIIYEAIVSISDSNRPADILTVGEHLKARGLLEQVGGFEYLSKIQDAVPSVAYIDAHAKVIREKAAVRACINASMEVLSKGFGDYGDVDQFLDEAEKKIFDATHKRALSKIKTIKEAVTDTFTQIDRLSSMKSSITGVPTGYVRLDSVTCGLQNSDLIVLAGRPSMGKTALALNIAVNAYRENKVPIVIFSLEMSVHQLMLRLLSSEAEVAANHLRVPSRLSQDEFLRLTVAADYLEKTSLFLDDSPELNVLEIRSRARRLKDEHDIGLIVVDYLQILRPSFTTRHDNREREVAEMSRSLKALAKELDIPIIALSQLSRSPEKREKSKRPQLADLRESGAIEQDADLVMFLYRETNPDAGPGQERPGAEPVRTELIIGKNRNGPTLTIPLDFVPVFTRFNDPEGEDQDFGGSTAIGGMGDTDVGGIDFD